MIERSPSLVVGQRVRLVISESECGWSALAAHHLDGKLGAVTEVRVPEPGTGLALLGVGYLVRLDEAVPAEGLGTVRVVTELWLARAFLDVVSFDALDASRRKP